MSCVVTEENFNTMKKITFAWVQESSAATGTTSNAYSGEVRRLVTIPGAGGLAPSANYDIDMLDQDSTDILIGAGANRHSANTEQDLAASLGVIANDTITINVASAGNSNAGTAIVYIR